MMSCGHGARLLTCALLLLFAACSKEQPQTSAAAPNRPPVEVSVIESARESVPMRSELPGRIAAWRVAELRARVSGILLNRKFEEGSDVKQGQVLFQIDPAPLKARHDSAKATLQRARANLVQVTTLSKRYAGLITSKAVSQQEVDDAEAMKLQREAEVLEAEAALRTAALNLSYATVTAPISGRIGKALVTEGALVGEGEATRMAVIQQLDPVYFDFEQSSAELLAMRRKLEGGELSSDAEATKITLLLEDNSEYEHPGTLLFSDATVDERTGMVTVRAKVPNPDKILLPGMFVRARIDQGITRDAVTVPQRAVALGEHGSATVFVVGEGDRVERRAIKLERAVGDKWIVSSGLEAGARVILEGRQKVRDGDTVKPVPPQDLAAAQSDTRG